MLVTLPVGWRERGSFVRVNFYLPDGDLIPVKKLTDASIEGKGHLVRVRLDLPPGTLLAAIWTEDDLSGDAWLVVTRGGLWAGWNTRVVPAAVGVREVKLEEIARALKVDPARVRVLDLGAIEGEPRKISGALVIMHKARGVKLSQRLALKFTQAVRRLGREYPKVGDGVFYVPDRGEARLVVQELRGELAPAISKGEVAVFMVAVQEEIGLGEYLEDLAKETALELAREARERGVSRSLHYRLERFRAWGGAWAGMAAAVVADVASGGDGEVPYMELEAAVEGRELSKIDLVAMIQKRREGESGQASGSGTSDSNASAA